MTNEKELIKQIKQSDPAREYQSVDDIKSRLGIKDDSELATLLRADVAYIKELKKSKNKLAKDIQAAARVVERRLKDMALSYGGMSDEHENWGHIVIDGDMVTVFDKDKLKLMYLMAYHADKDMVAELLEKFNKNNHKW
ncbi:hypothetical protein ACHJH3_08615 [Campylobacter sp. MOP7]|uniref:hypothetical protein n=1 Tax=Campylobacter canis TaxID=3378588 RepID=UPI00387E806B